MGSAVFERMTQELLAIDARVERQHSITKAEYSEWKRAFTFEGIKGLKYGQSFCNHFDITDYVLFYKTDWISADQHIRSVYLEKC
jgi:hypothetical protein